METSPVIDEGDVVGVLKARYFAVKEAIADAEKRHTMAVDGLNAPKAKASIANHEIELLKAKVEKTQAALKSKKEQLGEVKEDLGEAKTEIEENEDLRKEFKDADSVRTEQLEELEEKCKQAKEELFEVNRKFSESTRSLAMREFDLEATTLRVTTALQRIDEVDDMKTTSGQQMVHAEKRGGKTAERKVEKENKIQALTEQVNGLDEGTEDALRNILKLELQREHILDQIAYWNGKTQKIEEEINSANQDGWGL